MNQIICAIDTPERSRANFLVREIAKKVGLVKFGLEFFCAHGPQAIREYANAGVGIFLDLKFHDIPNTVAGAVRSATSTGCRMMTIHAGGGSDMAKAAVEAAAVAAAREHIKPPLILAVTILTSMDDAACAEVGYHGNTESQVLRLAEVALKAGVGGLVCSPKEVAAIRANFGNEPVLVVPGIRPVGSDMGDQKRVMTPKEAISAGANYLVIGRPITGAEDPANAAAEIAASL